MYVSVGFHEDTAHFMDYNTALDGRERRAQKRVTRPDRGYKIGKYEYAVLKIAAPERISDIPRKKQSEYHYVTIQEEPGKCWKVNNSAFIIEIDDEKMAEIAESVKKASTHGDGYGRMIYPRVWLAKDGVWWTFPHFEIYETGEEVDATDVWTSTDIYGNVINREEMTYKRKKRGIRLVEEYQQKELRYPAPQAENMNNDETNAVGFPERIEGNGMILEYKTEYAGKPKTWFLSNDKYYSRKEDSPTGQNYNVIKSTNGSKWSKRLKSWYIMGNAVSPTPPQAWLDLVGYGQEKEVEAPVTPVIEKEPEMETVEHAEDIL